MDTSTSSATQTKSKIAPPAEIIPDEKSPFFMSHPDMIALQCYLTEGVQLATTPDEATLKLGVTAEDAGKFADLWESYKTVRSHCTDFQQNTFPKTVNLAADLSNYGGKMAPIYYGALKSVFEQIDNGSIPNAEGQKHADEILQKLIEYAQGKAAEVDAVSSSISQFIIQTEQDKGVLDPIFDKYRKMYDGYEGGAGLLQQYRDRIADDKNQIDYWNDEYKRDVTIASTTATYAWIVPFGLIAAAVVAGVYAKRAIEAKEHIDEFRDQLDNDEEKLRSAVLMDADLKRVNDSLGGLLDKLNAALPILNKMKGVWVALAQDISDVAETLKSNVQGASTFIAELGVDMAIEQWKSVANEADQYRVNAFIVLKDRSEIERNPDVYALPQAA